MLGLVYKDFFKFKKLEKKLYLLLLLASLQQQVLGKGKIALLCSYGSHQWTDTS